MMESYPVHVAATADVKNDQKSFHTSLLHDDATFVPGGMTTAWWDMPLQV